jgi:uncharacterized protein (DUF488 family)
MMDDSFFPIFTIGHSLHSEAKFIRLLRQQAITSVIDVRSSPFSRRAPQYSRPMLGGWLAQAGIDYKFAGVVLGGRPQNYDLYVAGRADYGRMAQMPEFLSGLRQLARFARRGCSALLCAEADPIECHRFLLVSRALSEKGMEVRHILPSGSVESQAEAEERLMYAVGLLQTGLFEGAVRSLSEAYSIQSCRVAYTVARPGTDSTTEDS